MIKPTFQAASVPRRCTATPKISAFQSHLASWRLLTLDKLYGAILIFLLCILKTNRPLTGNVFQLSATFTGLHQWMLAQLSWRRVSCTKTSCQLIPVIFFFFSTIPFYTVTPSFRWGQKPSKPEPVCEVFILQNHSLSEKYTVIIDAFKWSTILLLYVQSDSLIYNIDQKLFPDYVLYE